VRIWIDMTAPAHVLVFRPVIERLRRDGHDVEVTARDYAQTLGLLHLHGIEHTAFGRHGGARRARKLASLLSRTRQARRFARRGFDLAIGHGSNDLALAAAAVGIPAVNTFDYEWAATQHRIGCRLARRVLVPEAIPPERLAPYGARAEKLLRYPGLKEEYYLADFEPDGTVLDELGVDGSRVLVVLRPPPDVSLYHRRANAVFPQVVDDVGARADVHAVVLPRTLRQREELQSRRLPSLLIADRAVDAQSLIAFADLVVSAGGTMNREAVALGTPVYTTYGGRLGGVDEDLLRQGRLRPLVDPSVLDVRRRTERGSPRVRRDPGDLARMMLSAVQEVRSG
jgi:predicted glycosyltransferase